MVKKNLEELMNELVEIDKEIERRIRELKELMVRNNDWDKYIV